MGGAKFHISDSVNTALSDQAKPSTKWSLLELNVGKRHWLTILLCLGVFNIYTTRVALSIAIVAMVKPPVVPSSNYSLSAKSTGYVNRTENQVTIIPVLLEICPEPAGLSSAKAIGHTKSPRFEWDSTIQGHILGSYFYGYIVAQIPGGWLARRFGGKLPFGLGILIAGILTVITPIASGYHYGAVIAIRVAEGLSTAICFPALHHLLSKWSPSRERTRMSTLVAAGAPIGNVVVLGVSGFIGDYLGWEYIFYVYSGVTGFWFILFQVFVYNSPSEHPGITDDELKLITGSVEKITTNTDPKPSPTVPWRRILTSLPVWAIVFAHFGQNWGNYTLLTNLPTYMRNILNFELSANGVFSALPHLALWIFSVSSGYASDYLRHHKYLSTTNCRKLFNTVGNLIPAVALITVGYVGCDWVAAVTLLTVSVGFSGLTQSSYQVNSLDLSLAFASTIFSFSNTIANVPGIISPYSVGLITAGPDGQSVLNWQIIFYLSGGIRIFTMIVYGIFASGEVAPWNYAGDLEVVNK
ncbi:Sialin [Hypsibius exemplaris]|uniref:Sialin n=1 Tax=Hypsibius exemplaris TaxID=2072580 RepID=A0A1W0XBX8_HYPEX|nr:Sialin [Hypsibius exemplaris]